MPTPPANWVFNDCDRRAYEARFWRCPTRLVTAGDWADFWRKPGTTRGGGVVTSLVPVLAVHAWPDQSGAEPGWTGWSYLSRRRLATLAGINKDSVAAAYQRLVELNLMELERRPRTRHEGGYRNVFSPSCHALPAGGRTLCRGAWQPVLRGGVGVAPKCRLSARRPRDRLS